ncbi:MAG TPA: ABC transporter permease [Bryobacteraceae bacterium]|nr:ABC transporter permease [Bryobacteraceae bacterium]
MLNDVRFALRRLVAAKGFTITALLTLALGIGANTGIFTLVNALMLKTLPVADPQSIVRVGGGDNCCVLGGFQGNFSIYSYDLYQYLKRNTPEFEDMSAFQGGLDRAGVRRAGAEAAEPFVDQFVSGNYFTLFGLRPFAGRLIVPADDVRGAAPVAVMSYRAWQQHYGGDPSVIGSAFTIEGAQFTIIGVTPPGFFGAALRPDPPDFWMPLAAEPATHGKRSLLDEKTAHWLYAFARLKPGMEQAAVEAKLTAELKQWLATNEPSASGANRQNIDKQHISLVPGGAGLAEMRDNYRADLRLLMGITGLVLLIACANLANLQLARGTASAGQTAIRAALGAPRSRLIRQVLIESTILSVSGGALGLLVAFETSDLLLQLAFRGAQFVPIHATPSLPVLGFALLLSVLTGAGFGLAPAWSASRADPAMALRGAGRNSSGRSSSPQKVLVVLQAALSLVLLAGAGLMTQTLRNLTRQQWGFQIEGTVVVDVNAGFGGYGPEKLTAVYSQVDRELRQIPEVRQVALALYSPMSGNNWQMGATIEERPQQQISPSWDRVSGTFFETIGARIVRGRTFDERDTSDSTHVAVINETFAKNYFPDEDPIGKRFGLGGFSHRADYDIIGVVNTIRFRDPRGPGRPMFFVPMLQMRKDEWNDTTLARSNVIGSVLLRVGGRSSGLGPRIQRTLGKIDPNLTVLSVSPVSEHLSRLVAHERLIGTLAVIFGALALLLASVGLYGITSYSVARRTSEIGVRTALGATPGEVILLILKDALAQAGMGVALGIPAALAAGRMLAGQLYGVKNWDPLILGSSAVVLGVCAAVAGVIPAARASSVDAVQALRTDA